MRTRIIYASLLFALGTMAAKAEELQWPPDRKTKEAREALDARFYAATRDRLGSEADVEAIRAAIAADTRDPQAHISEVRWLSPSVVMVRAASFHALRHLCVVRKVGRERNIVVRYETGVS